MSDRLLTPSKITAWLDCAHFLTLQHQVDDGSLKVRSNPFGSLAKLLLDKGLEHETACLDDYRAQGLTVLEVPQREKYESFQTWVDRIGDLLATSDADVLYQMPFADDGIRGIADFLLRVEDSDTGQTAWEPVDAKLARAEAKPGHVLQLCFYADAIEAATGRLPNHLHLLLGSGELETIRAEEVRPYWNRLRHQLAALVDADSVEEPTTPEPCAHCDFCEFNALCEDQWRSEDSLIYLATSRRSDRDVLKVEGVTTIDALAHCDELVTGLDPERLSRLVGQAKLQVEARVLPDDEPPPYRLIEPADDPNWGHGFEHLPEPDDGDLFLDFEGHPFWRADTGLFFLFGFIARAARAAGTDNQDPWTYDARWAHDLAEEADATRSLIAELAARRAKSPGMHVYHYNHTERSALEHLADVHGVGEAALANLVETGLFVDLYPIARNAAQVGVESYGLKHLERLTDFVRGDDIHQGSGAVVEYEDYTHDHEQAHLDRIAAYNEDDVRATLALRDWLIDHRPADLPWRPATLELEDATPDLDEKVAALRAFGPDTPEHLLGDLLGYWLREARANRAPKLARAAADTASLLFDPETLAGLEQIGEVERTGKNGRVLIPSMAFRLPQQEISADLLRDGAQVLYPTIDGPPGYTSVAHIDVDEHVVELMWGDNPREHGTIPTAVMLNDWVPPRPKPEAIDSLASAVIDPATHGPAHPVAMALLRRELPVFTAGQGPAGGEFTDDLDDMTEWVRHLDHSYVAVQGPPGTGKTFRGAHLIHSLITAGRRVGVTAMSHNAIDNLLDETLRVFDEKGDRELLRVVRRVPAGTTGPHGDVDYTTDNKKAAKPTFNLVAGTTWLFANNDMRAAPVDVLIVDEAGQLALVDALVASLSATNLVLLGDPLQLPQVAQAAHPGGSGASALEHILGEDTTLPADRGPFLAETRRMHPDVCRFISERIYEGRLTSHESCALQGTEFGTGLRWLRADHDGNSTESQEEAEVVAAEISRLTRTSWTNQKGVSAPLGPDDFMVVAPYNDQVRLLRQRLDAEPTTRGVQVGTIDKFQGRQAAVVFCTMTTSSASYMTRASDFLFSRNRLNVAISRARCLAYLVCTDELLNARARDLEEMRLIATLCAFVEYATEPSP